MNEKRAELIEYIRVLYARQSDMDSKAGITSWAVLAGITYLIFQLTGIVSQSSILEQSKVYFYYAFSQIHLSILASYFILNSNRKAYKKEIFDYRIVKNEQPSIKFAIIIILNIALPLYCSKVSRNIQVNGLLREIQQQINYWSLLSIIIFIIIIVLQIFLKHKDSNMPPPIGAMQLNNIWFKIFAFLFYTLFFILLTANINYIFSDIYGNNLNGAIYTAALDVSLIFFGLTILIKKSYSTEYLSRLTNLEMDIVIHEISEKEITDRLQYELLGHYIGDWIEKLLIDLQKQADNLIKLSENSDKIINEIKDIDEKYTIERQGRTKEHITNLKNSLNSYNNSLNPLISWLKEAELQSSINKDEFIHSLVSSSLYELKSSSNTVEEKVKKALICIDQHLD